MPKQKDKKLAKKKTTPSAEGKTARAKEKRRSAQRTPSTPNRDTRLTIRVNELEARVARLVDEKEQAKKEAAFFKSQLDESQSYIRSLHKSTSWKLTAPVRGLKKFISGPTKQERQRYQARPPALSSWAWRKLAKLDAIHLVESPDFDAPVKLVRERSSNATRDSFPMIVHAFHQEIFAEVVQRVSDTWPDAVLYVSTPIENTSDAVTELESTQLGFKLYETQNIGRDIYPFLSLLPHIKADGWSFFLKLHTKKSPQLDNGTAWKNDLFNKLIDDNAIRTAIEIFNTNNSVGILAPKEHILSLRDFIGKNDQNVKTLSARYNLKPGFLEDDVFVAGSMFFGRVAAFETILNDPLSAKDFEIEAGLVDGTLAHTVERIIGKMTEAAGMEVRSIESPTTKSKGLEKASYQFL